RIPGQAGARGSLFFSSSALVGLSLAAAIAMGVAGCRRSPSNSADSGAPSEAATRLFFPRLHDMVVIKIDPPEESVDANGGSGTPPSDLFIDRFEVTDGEYASFLAATRYRPAEATLFLDHWPKRNGERAAPREPDTPVRWVALEDALAFAHFR